MKLFRPIAFFVGVAVVFGCASLARCERSDAVRCKQW